MTNVREISFAVPTEANTQTVALSDTSAQSAPIMAADAVVMVDAAAFVVQGSNPTATTSCMPLLANVQYRVRITPGNVLAFVLATGTGNAYITPGS